MASNLLTRRRLLGRSLALGCSLAASPLITPISMASAPWDNRLVVIILRGGMDGLDVVRPYGAAEYPALRGTTWPTDPGKHDLDGFFALHPALSDLMPLWRAGQLGFAHAVSTPYRDKRSHFDGQDMLEAGTNAGTMSPARDGWLNRMLQQVPGITAKTAFAVGRSDMLLTRGTADVSDWSPDASLALSPQARRLLETVMHDDPMFRDAIGEAIDLSESDLIALAGDTPLETGDMMNSMRDNIREARNGADPESIARFAAARLLEETRIAAFSLSGFDTHSKQVGGLSRALQQLGTAILILQRELGPVWDKTAVVAMTEFGRTARINGTGGTDHGTGGAMLYAGGALRGGKVETDWPGLAEADLYAGRDLMPTRDVRAHAGWVMRHLFGLDRSVIENAVFPGLDLGPDPKLTL